MQLVRHFVPSFALPSSTISYFYSYCKSFNSIPIVGTRIPIFFALDPKTLPKTRIRKLVIVK
jgi:hypothetical protein